MTMTDTMGLLLHGVLDTHDWTDGGEGLRQCLTELPGVHPGEPPSVIMVGRLGALVSAVPVAEFIGPALEANLESIQWLEPRARAHAGVIQAVFALQAVLPMRFGTLFSTSRLLVLQLGGQSKALLGELEAIRDQEEWTIRFCANPEAMLEEMAANVTAGSQKPGRGSQYLLQRRFAVNGRSDMISRLTARAEEAQDALARHALFTAGTRTEITGVPGGRRSLLSTIYTVARADRPAFLGELEQVSALLCREGFTVLHSGPWPPAPSSGEPEETDETAGV